MVTRKIMLDFINKLSDLEREALEIASLIGIRFSLDHILDLSNIKPSKLLNLLDRMVDLRFLQEDSVKDHDTYAFKSKDIMAMIIESMKEDKKKLYLTHIIDHMERELTQDDKKSLVLAELFLKFKNYEDAIGYKKRAADLFASVHKTDLSLDLHKEVIDELLNSKNRTSTSDKVILVDSVISYARITMNFFPPDDILPLIEKTLPIAKQLKNDRAMAMLEVCLGLLYQHKDDYLAAVEHYRTGWRLADKTGDENLIKAISKVSALFLFWQGRISDAVQMYEKTLGNLETISPDLRDFWATLMLAYCYSITGRSARGLGLAEALREKALAKGDIKTQAFADAFVALIMLEIRQIEKAIPHIDTALEMGERYGNNLGLLIIKPCKAYVLYKKGDLEGARDMLASWLPHTIKLGHANYPTAWMLDILWSLHKANMEPIEGYDFRSEIARLKTRPDIHLKGVALRYEAIEKKMSASDPAAIEALLKNSHQLLKESGAKIELGRTQVELAKFYIGEKNNSQAQKYADMAYSTLTEIDRHLFPSELLFLIRDKSSGNLVLNGISELRDAADSLQDQDSYLGKAVTVLTNIFGAERSAILLTEDGNPDGPLRIAATRSFNPEELAQFDNEPLRTLIKKSLEKKEPLIISDSKTTADSPILTGDNFSVRSLACIPLVMYGKSIGLIYIDNRLLEAVFSEKDLAMMTAIATQIALYLKTKPFNDTVYPSKSPAGASPYRDKIESNKDFPQIVGKSKAIKNVLSEIKKVAHTDAPVLIYGETGVGKELVAQAIHQNSQRANKPIITVNISALSENLLPSELFGHEKGAFTSAEKAKVGRFEMAHQGTIFLDEIGDLSMDAQVKLLRVLQEGEFDRVGGIKTIHSDFRLIVATNRNLSDLVARGDFRSDLFYRIGTFPIKIPPLRERREDIPSLVFYFLHKYAAKHKKSVPSIPEQFMNKFLEYSWPGNIRELEHIIERMLILSESGEITIPDFEISPNVMPQKAPVQNELLTLDEISRRHILMVLNHVKWRIRGRQGAAEILGLKPSTLEYRIKRLGINR